MREECELLIVSGGKGDVSKLFERDNEKSLFDKPMRTLAAHYVHGMLPAKSKPGVCVNLIPGAGEYFTMPGLTLSGHCEMMLFEGIMGGDMDCWSGIESPDDQLEKGLSILKRYLPWEWERCKNIELTDQKAVLKGSYTPTVRKPFFTLPKSQKLVLGMADTIVLNDPVAGQGANNASKNVKIYMDSIVARKDMPFDKDWMQKTFNIYWDYAKWATKWTNTLLQPPEPHIVDLLIAATQNQKIANKIANGFNNPADLFPWVDDKKLTHEMISSLSERIGEVA